jgi:acetyltransferase-like isoleucine patch superfamily enzyme
MRKITIVQILIFEGMLFFSIAVGVAVSSWVLGLSLFSGFWLSATAFVFYLCAIIVFRLFQRLTPLPAGDIAVASRTESIYHVYLLHFLLLFYPVMRSGFVPVPLLRVFYLLLGARLGANTYSAGILYDPLFVRLGDNCIVGQGALVIPHAIEGMHLSHQPIHMGNNVTIGAYAVILQGCNIGNNVVIGIGSVVSKGTQIPDGEVWAGVPARCIRRS